MYEMGRGMSILFGASLLTVFLIVRFSECAHMFKQTEGFFVHVAELANKSFLR